MAIISIEEILDDIQFAIETEKAWKRYEKGEFRTMDFDEFIKELETW